jgi:hypothetical protein
MFAQPDPTFADRLETRLVDALNSTVPMPDHRFEEDLMTIDLDPATDSRTASSRRRVSWIGFAAAAAAAALLVVFLVVRDDPDATSSTTSTEVSFDVEWPPLRSDSGVDLEQPDCITGFTERHQLAVNGCPRSFKGVTRFTGDVIGEGLWSMVGGTGSAADSNDDRVITPAPFNATYLFSGEVPGCGTGEFMMASQLQFVGWAAGEFVGTWSIVPNSGRGELSTISGSGEVQEGSEGVRPHTGSISC